MKTIEDLADAVAVLDHSKIGNDACNELKQATAVLLAGNPLADKKQALIFLVAMAHSNDYARELAVDLLRHDRMIRFSGTGIVSENQ